MLPAGDGVVDDEGHHARTQLVPLKKGGVHLSCAGLLWATSVFGIEDSTDSVRQVTFPPF